MTSTRALSEARLAVIATHPIQYYAPWFRHLANETGVQMRVFYLWDFGVAAHRDPGFGREITWDVSLLDGYDSEFVPNGAARPTTASPTGLWNPSLPARVRTWGPTAVLLTAYNFASLYWFLARWRRNEAPLLFRGDSNRLAPTTRRGARMRAAITGRVLRRFDAALYVGAANRRYYLAHGVSPARLYFAPHAVDNARFMSNPDTVRSAAAAWRESLGIPTAHRVVLFAGKLEPRKEPQSLVRAFRRAQLEHATLVIVGDGPLEGAMRSLAGDDPHIRFASFQNQSRMPMVYAAADLVVLPSAQETWGLAINEAQCLARAVIVSSHVGCAEDLVEHGVNGLVFPAGNVDALTAALVEALSDDERLAAWGQAGRERVAHYSYQSATAGLLDALAAVMPRHQ